MFVAVRLATNPLLKIITQLALLQELDLGQVKPFTRLSAFTEVATLMRAFNGLTAALKEYRKYSFLPARISSPRPSFVCVYARQVKPV